MSDDNSNDDEPPPETETGGAGDGGKNNGRITLAGDDDDDRVGYKRPPRRHQFKPGKSGNPRGRPKAARGTNTLLREVLGERYEITDKGKRRKVTLRELIHRRLGEKAAKGDLKAIAQIMIYDERLYGFDESPQLAAPLSPEEQAIIDDARQRRDKVKLLSRKAHLPETSLAPPKKDGGDA